MKKKTLANHIFANQSTDSDSHQIHTKIGRSSQNDRIFSPCTDGPETGRQARLISSNFYTNTVSLLLLLQMPKVIFPIQARPPRWQRGQYSPSAIASSPSKSFARLSTAWILVSNSASRPSFSHFIQHRTENAFGGDWTQEYSFGIRIDQSVYGTWKLGGAALGFCFISQAVTTFRETQA